MDGVFTQSVVALDRTGFNVPELAHWSDEAME